MTREENKKRDSDRPIIVHCIGLLVQQSTLCDADDAINAAWNIWDYLGQPKEVGKVDPKRVEQFLRDHR